jgi:hypothetical protein
MKMRGCECQIGARVLAGRGYLANLQNRAPQAPADFPQTSRRLPADSPQTPRRLLADSPQTSRRLPADSPQTSRRLRVVNVLKSVPPTLSTNLIVARVVI